MTPCPKFAPHSFVQPSCATGRSSACSLESSASAYELLSVALAELPLELPEPVTRLQSCALRFVLAWHLWSGAPHGGFARILDDAWARPELRMGCTLTFGALCSADPVLLATAAAFLVAHHRQEVGGAYWVHGLPLQPGFQPMARHSSSQSSNHLHAAFRLLPSPRPRPHPTSTVLRSCWLPGLEEFNPGSGLRVHHLLAWLSTQGCTSIQLLRHVTGCVSRERAPGVGQGAAWVRP